MKIREYFGDITNMIDYVKEATDIEKGSFSVVHLLDNHYALKVTKDEAYLSFLEVVENCHEVSVLNHLPKIYDRVEIEDIHYILMERLYEFESENEWEAEIAGYCEKDSGLWWDISDSLNKALEYVDAEAVSREDIYKDDYRTSNLMETKDGTIVITDPWCVGYSS